jgi:hypothetical protein
MNASHRDSYLSVFFKHVYFELLNWHLKVFCKCFPLLLFICYSSWKFSVCGNQIFFSQGCSISAIFSQMSQWECVTVLLLFTFTYVNC